MHPVCLPSNSHTSYVFSLETGNTIFEPGKEGSGEKGSGSGSGDKPDTSSNDEKVNHADEEVDHETKR